MKEIVIRTLAGLGPGFGLYGYCGACGRMERLERKALIRALGWDAELERIRRGLRCGECGGAGWTALPYLGRVRGVQVRRWLGRL